MQNLSTQTKIFFPVLQALPWPAALVDEAGFVVLMNEAMEERTARTAERQPLADILPEHVRALRGDPPWPSQERLITQDRAGETVHERFWLRSIPTGAVVIVVDESRAHQLEAERMQTVRLASLGFLLAGVSHEISNPLAAIYSMLQLIKGQAMQDPQMLHKGLESISSNVHRILEISRKLSGFSRVDSEQKRPCTVDWVIEESLGLVRHERSFRDVSIEHHKDPEAVVCCSANEMAQVFFNILSNAVQAMEGCGTISITTRRIAAKRVEVLIRDDGPGIRPDLVGRLFEPFFSTKPTGQGTGLGLTISNELVREHGGTLRAESDFGAGARFYVELPLWSRG